MSAAPRAGWFVVIALASVVQLGNVARAQDGSTPGSHAADPTSPATPPAAALRLQVFGGIGVGTRSMNRPISVGVQRLEESVFPATEFGLRVRVWPEQAFSLAVLLTYQTSIGWTIDEKPLFAIANEVSVRAERAELSVAPSLRLGDSPRAMAVSLPIGFALRTFLPDLHDQLSPRYTLLGPLVRAELSVALGEAINLRFGPELHWIVALDRSLRQDGVAAQGIAVGAEATLQVPLGRRLALELNYRESHAFAPNAAGSGRVFTDVERFATFRFAGTL
jgi:hypothetical protein